MSKRVHMAAFAALLAVAMPCPAVDSSGTRASNEQGAITGLNGIHSVAEATDWSALTGPPELALCGLVCPVLETLLSGEELAGTEDEVGCSGESQQQGMRSTPLPTYAVPSILGTRYGGRPPAGVELDAIDGRVVVVYVWWKPEGKQRAMRVAKKVKRDVAKRMGRQQDADDLRGDMSIWLNFDASPQTATGVFRFENQVVVAWACTSLIPLSARI